MSSTCIAAEETPEYVMPRGELIAKITALEPEIDALMRSYGMHEPDWSPLEKVLPYAHCGGFMFMGYAGRVRMYKHGITRRYLNLDNKGNAYEYVHATGGEPNRYRRIPLDQAIERVFEDLEWMGYARDTSYTDEVRAERHRRINEAGYTVVNYDLSGDPRLRVLPPVLP